MVHVICKVLSIVAGVMLLFFGVRLVIGRPEIPDLLWAAVFLLFALSFGLNLFPLKKTWALVLAAFHVGGVIYLVGLLRNMIIIARGESGSKEGLWQFFFPPVFMMCAFLISIIFNLVRPGEALRQG